MTLPRDTLTGSDLAELWDIARDRFADWAWRMGLQDADLDFDEDRWLTEAERIWMAAEPVATASEASVPPRRAA